MFLTFFQLNQGVLQAPSFSSSPCYSNANLTPSSVLTFLVADDSTVIMNYNRFVFSLQGMKKYLLEEKSVLEEQ